jgi:hypothetical protein
MDGKNPNPDPYKAELWVQNDAGEWIKIGNVEPLKPFFTVPNPIAGAPPLVSIEYGLTPEELKPIVPDLKDVEAKGNFTLEPLGILNAPIGTKWTDKPLKVEELFSMIPAHIDCKCVPSLEEPPPASARDLTDAFVARNQHPIECPPALELIGLLCANVGHTGANLRGYM